MISRINAKSEKALREALYSVTRIEADQIPPSLVALDEGERSEALALAVTVTGYVVIDACGTQWPIRSSVQRIAKTLATKSSNAQRLRLDPGEIEAYLSRTVLGPERLEDVIPGEPAFTRMPVVVAGEALAVYSREEIGIWDYLDQIETAIETASALDATALPAVIMRAYLSAQQPSGNRR